MVVCPREATGATNHHFLGLHARIVPWKILLSTRWMPSQPPIPIPSALQLPWGYRDVIIPIRFGGWPEGSYWGGESSIFGIARPVAPIVPWIFLRSTRWMPRHLPIFTPSALQLPWVNNDVMTPIRYGSLPGERIQRGRPAVSCASAVLLSESPRSCENYIRIHPRS